MLYHFLKDKFVNEIYHLKDKFMSNYNCSETNY